MATAAAAPSRDGVHFAIPEGTASITQPDEDGEGHDSWAEWRVNKEDVTSVSIPSSVTRIGVRAFEECSSLASVAIHSSVTRIEQQAFANCSSLANAAIPASVTSIEFGAFCECSSLASVAIPSSVTSIEAYAFANCSSLANVAIPSSVTMIEANAFYNCNALASVEISASVTTLGGPVYHGVTFYGAFEDCTSLAVLMVQPIETNDDDNNDDAANDDATPTAAAAATPSTSAIVNAFNEETQFPAVTRIWATDDVIKGLKGRFEAYTQFKDVPRALRAAPDAKTWAGVQLWLWWLPPTSFSGDVGGSGSTSTRSSRVVCKSRQLTVWVAMLCGLRAEEAAMLPRLPEELWLYMFGLLKHDQQPAFVALDA